MSDVEGFPMFQKTFELPSSRLISLGGRGGGDSYIVLALGSVWRLKL
jgi:hypothetical protein